MNYTVLRSKQFDKKYEKLSKNEKKSVEEKLKIMEESPLHPSLRTKHVQGTTGLFEASVNMNIRLIWCYEGDKIIMMLKIGHHDVLKRY
jgi:mRNA-degrading endonuclease RelE of RelBE toxin-antitoxin system